MSGNILFLDDSINRHLVFAKRFPGAVQVAYPVHARIEMQQEPFDEVWLDHDLGYVEDPELPTSPPFVHDVMPLVAWICDNKPDVGKFVIHSWNVHAARRMQAKLKEAGYNNVVVAPFSFTS